MKNTFNNNMKTVMQSVTKMSTVFGLVVFYILL